jgi:hypothetical protein
MLPKNIEGSYSKKRNKLSWKNKKNTRIIYNRQIIKGIDN